MPRCKDSTNKVAVTLQAKVDPCPWTTPGFSTTGYETDIENRRSSEIQTVSVLSRPVHNEVDINRGPFKIHIYPYIAKKGGRQPALHTLMPTSASTGTPRPEKMITTTMFIDELTPATREKLTTTCEFDVP